MFCIFVHSALQSGELNPIDILAAGQEERGLVPDMVNDVLDGGECSGGVAYIQSGQNYFYSNSTR